MMLMTTVASAVRATVDGRLSVARTLNCEEKNYSKNPQLEFLIIFFFCMHASSATVFQS